MSRPSCLKRYRRAGIVLASGLALSAAPAVAQAAAVDLGTAQPFVVLGGSTVTNTGPSVLNGDLGVAPGTSLVGFGSPAVVNGATHDNDAVANQAQADLTTAYNVAAGQPYAPADDLTGTDLGSRTLTAGAYHFSSSAQLTGALTLDAQGDPSAQFVFEIGSTLTTASASSVVLINGASPCNVFWQVGSSATLDTDTAFQGTLMALTDISLNARASVVGRMLARNGQVTLINNVLNAAGCQAGTTSPPVTPPVTPPTSTPPTATTPPITTSIPFPPLTPISTDTGSGAGSGTGDGTGSGTGTVPAPPPARSDQAPPASRSTLRTRRGTSRLQRTPGSPGSRCTDGFRAAVSGRMIKRVVFSLDGRRVASRTGSPFRVYVPARSGRHNVSARVTFKDATRAKTLNLGYRGCAAALRNPRRGPSQFTG